MTTTPPPQDSNRAAYAPDEKGRMQIQEAIRTWKTDRQLRSYRKTALAVCSNFVTVRDRIKKVDEMLDSGDLEIVNGEFKVNR